MDAASRERGAVRNAQDAEEDLLRALAAADRVTDRLIDGKRRY
jgi:hypothetical protein